MSDDAEVRKAAAEEAGHCLAADRDHVPGDFRVDLDGVATCAWCSTEVSTDV